MAGADASWLAKIQPGHSVFMSYLSSIQFCYAPSLGVETGGRRSPGPDLLGSPLCLPSWCFNAGSLLNNTPVQTGDK